MIGPAKLGRLTSLEALMRPYLAHDIIHILSTLREWEHWQGSHDLAKDENFRKGNATALRGYVGVLEDIGAAASSATIKKLIGVLESGEFDWKQIANLAAEFNGRLSDETTPKRYFYLTLHETSYFNAPLRGWDEVVRRFPQVAQDIEEASKCFALSRYAAAVFHSVQVVESGLIELGTFIKVADPKSGWTAVSNALNKIIKKDHRDRTKFERKNFAFLEQVCATVEGLKNAWRNKISHVHGKLTLMTADFSPDVAEEILFATRALMRRLCEGLPAPKQSQPSS